MARQASTFKVGIFVIAGVLIGLSALVYLGASQYLKGANTYVTFFKESVQGLQPDSVVKYRGVEVGRVRAIKVAPDNTLIEVVMDIQFPGPLSADMTAQLKMVGITGIAYIELDRRVPGDPDQSPPLSFPADHPVIASRPSDISQLFSLVEDVVRQLRRIDFKAIADQTQATMAAGQELLQSERLKKIFTHLESAAANVDSVSAKADRFLSKGELEALAAQAKAAMGEAKHLMEEARAQVAGLKLAETGREAGQLVEEVREDVGGLSGELKVTAQSLRRASESLDRMLSRLERTPSDALWSSPPTSRMTPAGGQR
jgi:phospholipid/cholesterol/gamma-HCH transport system substrate-binding protein